MSVSGGVSLGVGRLLLLKSQRRGVACAVLRPAWASTIKDGTGGDQT